MNLKILPLVITLAILSVCPSSAATCDTDKHPGITALLVKAHTKQTESVGREWVFHFRELIRRSASFCLVETQEKALLVLSILAADADPQGVSAAISIVAYEANGNYAFLHQWLYVAGNSTLEHSTQSALADLDESVEDLKKQ